MKRAVTKYLQEWKDKPNRKPLVIRGARQTGKTWLVRDFGKNCFYNIVEINFDRNPDIASIFQSPDTKIILQNLELTLDTEIIPGKTLLFLDEIQNKPKVFSRLRYFYEDLPSLHIIAAGSLLDFMLQEHSFSMPVGRIEYLFMGPMTFEEFLDGIEENKLVQYIQNFDISVDVPEVLHTKLISFVRQYFILGGMPGVIKVFKQSGKYKDALQEQNSILQTYLDDFSKYRGRIDPSRLQKVFIAFPKLVGQKVKYVKIDRFEKSVDISRAVKLLTMAGIIYPVTHTDANGLPLGAEENKRDFKALFLDIGLMQSLLDISYQNILDNPDLISVNSGSLAEQYTGQHLLHSSEYFKSPSLYYWNRYRKSSSAEVDYLTVVNGEIVPLEVKAGKTGTMKSLHLFVSEKKSSNAIRIYSGTPEISKLETIIPGKDKRIFVLLSLPFYLIGQYQRLLGKL